jgi:hypothetical protein
MLVERNIPPEIDRGLLLKARLAKTAQEAYTLFREDAKQLCKRQMLNSDQYGSVRKCKDGASITDGFNQPNRKPTLEP